jgi:hypothetical protein
MNRSSLFYTSGTPRSGVTMELGQLDGGHSPPYGPAVWLSRSRAGCACRFRSSVMPALRLGSGQAPAGIQGWGLGMGSSLENEA